MANGHMSRAFFGPPRDGFVGGGAHVTIYLIPVLERRLVVFDVSAEQARGRWLPWAVMDFGQNPYEAASALADDWCQGAVSDLTLADVMSFPVQGGGWELAIIFRAELTAEPESDADRRPWRFPEGHYDAIGSFDLADLERWVTMQPASRDEEPQRAEASPAAGQPPMLF